MERERERERESGEGAARKEKVKLTDKGKSLENMIEIIETGRETDRKTANQTEIDRDSAGGRRERDGETDRGKTRREIERQSDREMRVKDSDGEG